MKTRKQARLEQIQSGYQSGKTLTELGSELGISHEYVRQLAAEIGLKFSDRRKLSEDRKQTIVTLWNSGSSKAEISEELGIDYGNLRRLLPAGFNPNNEPSHGSVTRYRRGCRCDRCRSANAAYFREFRASMRAQGRVPYGTKHGYSGYVNYGCRCEVCTEENRAMAREQWRKHSAKRMESRRAREEKTK